jgi:hypothetical protein
LCIQTCPRPKPSLSQSGGEAIPASGPGRCCVGGPGQVALASGSRLRRERFSRCFDHGTRPVREAIATIVAVQARRSPPFDKTSASLRPELRPRGSVEPFRTPLGPTRQRGMVSAGAAKLPVNQERQHKGTRETRPWPASFRWSLHCWADRGQGRLRALGSNRLEFRNTL